MGNQTSKGSGASTPKGGASQTNLNQGADNFSSYPSFSKADTKESARSFRGAIRSKIPGTLSKVDSPRNSIAGLPNGESGDGDAVSVKSGRSSRTGLAKTTLADSTQRAPDSPVSRPTSPGSAEDVTASGEESKAPPSPIQSAAVRSGHHDIDSAQRSGEVDHVSDQPPSGGTNPHTHLQRAGNSILIKRENSVNPISSEVLLANTDAGGNPSSLSMAMNDMKETDVDDYIKRLLDAGYAGKSTKGVCLRNAEINSICSRVKEIFMEQPPLIELEAPVKIVGDIHGQYSDLIRMFEMCGFPPSANFLFLGDYVDRGKHSLETILLLMCYKIKYPENFFLLRGNHECANVTRVYGFYDECKRRCNVKVWKTFVDTFNCVS